MYKGSPFCKSADAFEENRVWESISLCTVARKTATSVNCNMLQSIKHESMILFGHMTTR